ncbi:MAG TPA: hypothetical protein VMH77_08330 [Steroidobacteraceae bacterium]|nr:hypothetical protein [Steroidobacteraceae bacterium]
MSRPASTGLRRYVQAMAVVTLLLAACTVYLGLALRQQRAHRPHTATAMPVVSARGTVTAPRAGDGAAATAAVPDGGDDAALRAKLDQYKDPAMRANLVANSRRALTRFWEERAKSMQLEPGQLDRLLDTLAEQAVRFDQRRVECQLDAGCDLRVLNGSLRDEARQNLANNLTPAANEQYLAYLDAVPERTYVQELQNRLSPDSRIADEAFEQLVLALADERRQFVTQLAQQGVKVQVTVGFVVQEFHGDTAPEPLTGPMNPALTSQLDQRLRDRAGKFLDAAQLAAFHKLQDERVGGHRLLQGLAQQ